MILAIETSTRQASLVLRNPADSEPVWESTFVTDRAHNAAIFGPLQELMREHRDLIEGIVVGLGPGSYGGIRVGIAVANGISMSLGKPTCGVSSLEGWGIDEDSYVVVGDARRKSWFIAEITDSGLRNEPSLFEVEKAREVVREISDSGRPVVSADESVVQLEQSVLLSYPVASRLIDRVTDRMVANWKATNLEPHYLRAPYITKPTTRK
ncbi:MAG: tRNA (adenosine(37)-N6)-threonylcarbamoyltransferase complex dimerization subunit type 1 TsaB [Verrucomicrobiota bacterium]